MNDTSADNSKVGLRSWEMSLIDLEIKLRGVQERDGNKIILVERKARKKIGAAQIE